MPQIRTRPVVQDHFDSLCVQGIDPVLARIYAARGIRSPQQISASFEHLLPFNGLKNCRAMAELLADAIKDQKRLLIIGDYDSDGATACAVGIRALRAFGATVDYLVPNRFEYGYGLTPEIVQLAALREPDILITVDNGIASIEGVAEAHRLGMSVLVTDHHLPGDALPAAACIVNPNQFDCDFPSKNLAGVGVIFYVMLALRTVLRERGHFEKITEPNLAKLLELVALGTVADVVKLDDNNRILVHQGLRRIRAGQAQAGIRALLHVGAREARKASAYDLGFVLGPRLNAAGRLNDMSLGIECLITDDEDRAHEIAKQLDALNRERREIESGMQDQALVILDAIKVEDTFSLSLFDPGWHQGVIGILASRMKDKFHRPVIAFARGNMGELKGSGRAINGLHLRDALDLVSKKNPQLILKFGGHAAAAGLTIRESDLGEFSRLFEAIVRSLINDSHLQRIIETDGDPDAGIFSLNLARQLEQEVWGQGFPAPMFHGEFIVQQQQPIGGDKHLKLKLGRGKICFDAVMFNHAEPLSENIRCVFRLGSNEYNGNTSLQLIIEHSEAI